MPKRTSWILLTLLTGAAAVMVHGRAGGEDPGEALAREVRRTRAGIARVVPEAQRAGAGARLDRAAAAREAGRLYLALYELELPWEIASGFAFAHDAAPAVTDLSAFTSRWKQAGEPAASEAGASRGLPLVVRALASAAESRGAATYHASLPYARDSDLASGLYYLGDSQAVGAFARLARSLGWPAAGAPQDLRSLAPELDAFEGEVTQAYSRMVPAQHTAYIVTSATLKRARALDDRGQFAGALLEYLVARHRFAPLRAADRAAATPDVGGRLAAARESLRDGRDHSIALLFVEMAEAAAASADEAARLSAAFVLGDVLPAYRAATGMAGGAGAPTAAAPASTATGSAAVITLVRWPFT